jgi:hypothetical protein
MNNLGSHKGKGVRLLIRAAGAKLFFLPRYSPDLNPIEQVFAKLKTLLRKTDPRTIETTWRGIGGLHYRFTPQECANYLANAGYASAYQDHALDAKGNGCCGAFSPICRVVSHRRRRAESPHLQAAPTNRRGSTQASELWVTLAAE